VNEPVVPGAEDLEGGEQQTAALAARYQRMAALFTRLATTARSFTLYDPGNEAVQRFLTTLLEAFGAALAAEGQVAVNVHPFELKFEGQTVYLNRDRERSLAFRLYRDGVRILTFYAGFDWEELTRLLEVLSIRLTGVHQREEDLVTLLWKANFQHLEIAAVEGVVPDEADREAGLTLPAAGLALPADLDLPRPELPPPRGPTWVTLSEESQAALRREASPAVLPWDGLALLERLRERLRDERDPMPFSEVAHLFAEVRDFLLAEDHLPALKSFLTFMWDFAAEPAPAWDAGREAALYDVLDGCGDRRAIKRMLRSLPAEQKRLRPQLLEILDRCCPEPVTAVADVLAEETSPTGRAVARQILEHYGARKLEVLQNRFVTAGGQLASDLLRVIAGIGGEAATAFVAQQAAHRDPAVQDEALYQLGTMPYSGIVGRALFDAFRVTDAARRPRVLEMIARTRDFRFVELLASYVEDNAATLSPDAAASLGRVLGLCGGEACVPRFTRWLEPAGVLRRGFAGPLARTVAAALALSEVPGDTAAEALGAAFDACDEESQPWILGALAQRQRRGTAS
jgi:hypothetical protein